jgi:hypothetical protein
MVWARVSGPAFSGSLPPNASPGGLTRPGRAVGRVGHRAGDPDRASGRQRSHDLAALASFGSAMTSSATRRTCQPISS